MLKVLLDARKLGDGGIGVYLENLISGLAPLVEADELALSLIVDAKRKEQPQIATLLASLPERVTVLNEAASRYSLNEYLAMPLRLKQALSQADIFHSPHYTLPFFVRCKSVITVHDVIHYTFPDTRWHRVVGGRLIQSGLRRADAVLTVSERSKEQIIGNFDVERGKVVTVANALQKALAADVAVDSAALTKLGVQVPFALFVGSSRPHKGLSSLLVAWSILQHWRSKQGLERLSLVIVGRLSDAAFQEIKARRLEEVVVVLDAVEPSAIQQLYRAALFSVIASLEEGFGFVALESMASDCALVSTPLPSVKEIAQDTAWYAEGFSAQDIFYAMKSCLGAATEQVLERKARAKHLAKEFSLPRFTAETVAVYRRVVEGQVVASRHSFAGDDEQDFSW